MGQDSSDKQAKQRREWGLFPYILGGAAGLLTFIASRIRKNAIPKITSKTTAVVVVLVVDPAFT